LHSIGADLCGTNCLEKLRHFFGVLKALARKINAAKFLGKLAATNTPAFPA